MIQWPLIIPAPCILDTMSAELRLLALRYNCILNVVHIVGTKMIQVGIDGLSGDKIHLSVLVEARGSYILPLHLNPII